MFLRINEFMRDYDPLRSDSITRAQFLSSLSQLKIYLSRKEAEMLCNKYENPEPGKEGEDLWTKFADDIDIVFVVKNLEKRADINNVTNITKSSFKLNELSLPEQAILQEILIHFSKMVRSLNSFTKPKYLGMLNSLLL